LEAVTLPRPRRPGPPPIEDRALKAIRRGQSAIDMRLDLHGETQMRAHRLLERALAAGQARGARIVLIVTGTGLRRRLAEDDPSPGEDAPGVLRRMLPQWLAAPPFADWVLGLSPAAQHHGGAGAFYVLLRRQRALG
jgi:DNA-nicking Smr family endonuclease